jgi:ribosomal protein S18 acetylase RimI-like enzyme
MEAVALVSFGWARAAAAGLTFRRTGEADMKFLLRVFKSTRTEELAAVPWSDGQKAAFLDMQFRAQHSHYQQNYPKADWLVTMRGGQDVGRLYIERCHHEHCLIDIAFLPEHRGDGLGAALLRDLVDEAAARGRDLQTHVEKSSPALRLYRRLGFVAGEDEGVYTLMRWSPAIAAPAQFGADER